MLKLFGKQPGPLEARRQEDEAKHVEGTVALTLRELKV